MNDHAGLATAGALCPGAKHPTLYTTFARVVVAAEVVVDLLASCTAVLATFLLCSAARPGEPTYASPHNSWTIALAFAVATVLLLDRDGAYKIGTSLLRIRETERVLRSVVTALLLLFAGTYFGAYQVPRLVYLVLFCVAPPLIAAEKHLFYAAVTGLHAMGYGLQRTMIHGAGYTGQRVYSALARSPKLGMLIVSVVDENSPVREIFQDSYERKAGISVTQASISERLLRDKQIDHLIITHTPTNLARIMDEALKANVSVWVVPGKPMQMDILHQSCDIDGLLLAAHGPQPRIAYEVAKRSL